MPKWFNRLIELIQDWKYLTRRDGWKAGLPQVGKGIASLPYRRIRYVVMARSLIEPLPEGKPKIRLEIRPFQASDLDFVRREYLPSEANLCARRLERGHYGVVAYQDGQVMGYRWGSADTSLERVDLHPEPCSVLFTDSFTRPAVRCKGVCTALSITMFGMFRDMGYQRVIAYIEIHNEPSLAVWRKMGAQVVAHIDFKRIAFWRQTRCDG
jgi:hypothetical protein